MSHSANETVQLRFSHTEKEYLAAIRFYFWHAKELLARLIIVYVLFSAGLLLLQVVIEVVLPLWANIALIFVVGLGWFHGWTIDRPRAYFRGDPKFRDEYTLTFTDVGISFKTQHASSTLAWSFYTGWLENDSFYILIYGKNIHSLSILPKRAFRDSQQEATFRQMLRRNIDGNSTLSQCAAENQEYVPKSLEPPDWR
ncbi:MAG TPA: YcxB family protein [Pyrinomonadaceae bacterium]|nr:YcxB family protein [Pyrinomonadaceae bacterium]